MLIGYVRRATIACIPLAAVLLTACGPSGAGGRAPTPAQARRDLAGAPPALASLHRQANEILPGRPAAFQARLRSLRGHPVVVNKWASWCAPCQLEFPVLQRESVKLGRRVAFVGLDARDTQSGARSFLARHPVSYPSYFDPREDLSRLVRAPEGFPITTFYDAGGRLVFQHAGPYTSDAQLDADVRKHLGS